MSERRRYAAEIARAVNYGNHDAEIDARRRFAAFKIAEILGESPPLTAEQRCAIGELMESGAPRE